MSEIFEPNPTTTMSEADLTLYLGENNTEARCAVYLTVPDVGLLPLNAIISEMRRNQAYREVSPQTFKVGAIINNTDESLLHTVRDPSPEPGQSSIWVEKSSDAAVAQRANAASGLLLAFSLDNNRAIRTLVGERRNNPDGSSSTIKRLSVLAVAIDSEDFGRGFDVGELDERLRANYAFTEGTAQWHIDKLLDNHILRPINDRSERLEFAVRADGQDARLEVIRLFRLIRTLVTGSPDELAAATERGRDIANDPRRLPMLIKRSYASSTHTGKQTPNSHKP